MNTKGIKQFLMDAKAISPAIATLILIVIAAVAAAGIGFIVQKAQTNTQSQTGNQDLSASGTIVIKGSTTVLPITQIAAVDFMKKYPAINLQISGGGSDVGKYDIYEKTVDIGASSSKWGAAYTYNGITIPSRTDIIIQDAGPNAAIWETAIGTGMIVVAGNLVDPNAQNAQITNIKVVPGTGTGLIPGSGTTPGSVQIGFTDLQNAYKGSGLLNIPLLSGSVNGTNLTNPGANLTAANLTYTITGGGSPTVPATVNYTVSGGIVSNLTISNGGSGYTSVPTLTFVDTNDTSITLPTATLTISSPTVSGTPIGNVQVIQRSDPSGTEDVFSNWISNGNSGNGAGMRGSDTQLTASTTTVPGYQGNQGVRDAIHGTPASGTAGTIGFVDVSFATGGANANAYTNVIAATMNSVAAGTNTKGVGGPYDVQSKTMSSQGLSRDLFYYSQGVPTGAVKAYLDYIVSSAGQDAVHAAGFYSI